MTSKDTRPNSSDINRSKKEQQEKEWRYDARPWAVQPDIDYLHAKTPKESLRGVSKKFPLRLGAISNVDGKSLDMFSHHDKYDKNYQRREKKTHTP